MKCLSVSQPFAELIISGKKTIELRNWNTNFRGEFLIHAPIKIKKEDYRRLKITKLLPRGVIVGKAELYDVKKYESTSELKKDYNCHFAKNIQNKKYGFLLKNQKAFRIPIPFKGKLGFFEVKLPKNKINDKAIEADIIDEEYRYQWIGHH
ncbi:ACP synthase [Nitrosopumilus sp. b1]|uniref:ASCH domain-containing protein n=1 Tax=Nitrosopumilus sp. b1 TaxID=2109907 RepID=UPI0015F4A97C|nr:ASCH domain-containing protein [Nitrosopumilus sp. b1]KAF6243782.1 ACP synthase [Nitrosopumilus sp. b1]